MHELEQKFINTPLHMDCFDLLLQLPNDCIDLIITSPPYNCRKDYGVVSDEVPWPQWYAMMHDFITRSHRVLRPGGVLSIVVPSTIRYQHAHKYRVSWGDYDPLYPCHYNGERTLGRGRVEPIGFRLFDMIGNVGFKHREPIIWVKGSEGNAISSNSAMGSDNNPFMRGCHELILLASKDRWFHDGGTGRRGRDAIPFMNYTKDVWHIPPRSSKGHPATFPLEIPLRLIRLFIHRANTRSLPTPVVADFFAGEFTTALAAQQEGIDWIACDLNSDYVVKARHDLANRQLNLNLD